MTFTDYLIDIAMIGLVLFQIRGRRLTARALVLPLAIVGYVATQYLHSIPTAGNDLVLIVGCTTVGALLGGLCALCTTITSDAQGRPMAKAGLVAAGLWVLGTGTRLAFQLYATHGGGATIEHFSASHDITSATAWTAALILMAVGEAVVRTAVLAWRSNVVGRLTHPQVQPLFTDSSGLRRAAIMDSGERTF